VKIPSGFYSSAPARRYLLKLSPSLNSGGPPAFSDPPGTEAQARAFVRFAPCLQSMMMTNQARNFFREIDPLRRPPALLFNLPWKSRGSHVFLVSQCQTSLQFSV